MNISPGPHYAPAVTCSFVRGPGSCEPGREGDRKMPEPTKPAKPVTPKPDPYQDGPADVVTPKPDPYQDEPTEAVKPNPNPYQDGPAAPAPDPDPYQD